MPTSYSPSHPTYVPDRGPHAGHVVSVVAGEMPSDRGVDEVWVLCECGVAWGFVDPAADERAKDGDGWPD